MLRGRLISVLEFYQLRHISKPDRSQPDPGDEGRAACVRLNRIFDLPHFHVEYVCKNLAPHIGVAAAARQIDL